jgi:hypothetical protein
MEAKEAKQEVRKNRRRGLTTRNVYERKAGRPVRVGDAVIAGVLGEDAECGSGMWLISGKEKNGKTSFALMLAKALAENHRVAYISAEEGLEGSFKAAMRRAGITVSDRITWEEYLSVERIRSEYATRATDFIFIDNLTVYQGEIRAADIIPIKKSLPGKTLVYIAHEEGNQPYPDSAAAVSKLAKIVFRVVAMNVTVVSRYTNGGGNIVIDADKKALFWGETVK